MPNRNLRRNMRLSDLKSTANVDMPKDLVFYCRGCHQILNIKPKNFVFKNPIEGCRRADAPNLNNDEKKKLDCEIVYGTERSIKRYFKIPDERFDQERREREEKAQRADKL